MNATCDACGRGPAYALDGRQTLCTACAQKRAVSRALPFIGAALAAAGLIAGSALLAERLQDERRPDGAAPSPLDELTKRLRGGTPTLGNFSRDLTALARGGKLDPVIGRDDEIERVVSILARRSKNNPVLVGEPGVGKTAIVEGLAQRIVAGNVRPRCTVNAFSRSRWDRWLRERSTGANSKAA